MKNDVERQIGCLLAFMANFSSFNYPETLLGGSNKLIFFAAGKSSKKFCLDYDKPPPPTTLHSVSPRIEINKFESFRGLHF